MGRALKLLRERSGLTQEAAADLMGVTKTAWANYEYGRAIVLRIDVQDRLVKALGQSRKALDETLREITGLPAPEYAHAGLEEAGAPFTGAAIKQAIFPLAEGDVTVSYPTNLSPASYRELHEYLTLFLRRGGERA